MNTFISHVYALTIPAPGSNPPITQYGFRPAPPGTTPSVTELKDFISHYWSTAFNTIFLILGGLAVLLLIYTGIQYISAAGNQDQLKKARTSLINITLGIILLVLSYTVIDLIVSLAKYLAG